MRFNSKVIKVYGVQISELNLLGKIGSESSFCMERDHSPERPSETEK